MIDFRSLLDAYEEGANNPALRHVALNYSETETGLRNRTGPVGVVNRDQGIFDAYAGRQRLLLGTEGSAILLARWAAIVADSIALRAKDITTLSILGKVFNPEVYDGRPLLTPRPGVDLSQFMVLNGEAPVPMSVHFETITVFQAPNVYGLQGTTAELFGLSDNAMRGI